MVYAQTLSAKTGDAIPVFSSGKPMHSKYNPQAETLALPPECTGGFFIIAGIGAGFHIRTLLQKNPGAAVIAFEDDTASLSFCRQFPLVRELESAGGRVWLCTLQELGRSIISRYAPGIYGDLFFLPQHAWEAENREICAAAKAIVTESLAAVSADYSVQAHFGKIWMRNILLNLSSFSANPEIHCDTRRTAAVIAAGPSLDQTAGMLAAKRDSYYIISTDTAYGSLLRRGLTPDAVVSVDGQHISTTHFFPCPERADDAPGTLFIFDICTNAEAVALVRKRGHQVYFVHSGHPLSCLAAEQAALPYLETGAGTVTIAACDFARRAGFTKLALFGADFAYSSGKPYTRGSYLDDQFFASATRTATAEGAFTALMYRTELTPLHKAGTFSGELSRAFTSPVLSGYEKTLLEWAERHGYALRGGILERAQPDKEQLPAIGNKAFSYAVFMQQWLSGLQQIPEEQFPPQDAAAYALLPYIAFLKKSENSGKVPFFTLFKLAYSHASRYNHII